MSKVHAEPVVHVDASMYPHCNVHEVHLIASTVLLGRPASANRLTALRHNAFEISRIFDTAAAGPLPVDEMVIILPVKVTSSPFADYHSRAA